MKRKNIVLIGMPSSGKSTIGEILAQKIEMGFVDTDFLIKQKVNKPLKDVVSEDGLDKFLEIQEDTILELSVEGHVIATGGSVIYNDAAMRHLKKDGLIVFLETIYSEVEQRITPDRRFAKNEGQSFKELFEERSPLYRKYADITINCTGRTVEEVVDEIIHHTGHKI